MIESTRFGEQMNVGGDLRLSFVAAVCVSNLVSPVQTDKRTCIFGPPAERVAEVAVEKSEEVVTETAMTAAPGGGTEIVIGSPWASGQAVGVARDDDSPAKVSDTASAGDGSSGNGCDLDNAAEEEGKDCYSGSNHSVRSCQLVGFSEDDLPPKILAVAGMGDASRSNDSNFDDAADYEGKDCFPESNYTVITLRRCGQGHQTSRKRVSRKCRNGARGFDSVFMSVVRRKRGSLSKRGRASVWGLLGNVTQLCTVSDVPGKVKGRNAGTGSTHIRFKVKVGKEAKPSSLNVADSGVVCASESDGAALNNCRMESFQGTTSEVPTLLRNGGEEGGSEKQLPPLEDKPEKAKSSSDGSITDVNPTNKDSEGTVVSSVTAGDAVEDYLRASSPVELEAFRATAEKGDADPATSPDSVVSIFVPEGQLGTKCNAANTNKVKPLKKRGGGVKDAGDSCTDDIVASSASANVSSNSSSSKEFSAEQIPLSTETEIEVSEDLSKGESGAEAQICGNLDGGDLRASELPNVESPVPTTKSKGQRHPRKSDGVSKRRPVTPASRSRQCNGNRKKGNERKSIDRNKAKEKSGCDQVHKKEDHSETENCIANEIGEFDCGDCNTLTNVAGLCGASSAITEQCLPMDNAWVRCDDCHKWRRISEELADSIGQTNCNWICAENIDKAFADCSIPQEMSNAEINAELGISDADEEAFDVFSNSMIPECNRITASKEHEFMHISTNQFLHRSRKTQTIDEIMVCGCKVPLDGGLGCRDGCLNRVLNIECIAGTCPCGDLCSNQQFQKRSYAKMKWDRCGKKGFGLQLEEDISRGQFLIEYVGEVLDIRTYQTRLKEYASMGHKHFYFMTLDGSEVIDACAKGNLGRFINHSCDPNCRTEKWVVNGEICIGLFALRDMKKGEEVTFDYNYVRVVGAAAKKCYCGSHHCRGYIGGDPTNAEVIDQVDSDEEFPEPVMLDEGESQNRLKDNITRASYFDGVEMASPTRAAVVEPEITSEVEDFMDQTAAVVSQLHKSLDVSDSKRSSYSGQPAEVPLQVEDVSSKPISAVQPDTSVEEPMSKTSSAIQMSEVPPTTAQSKVSPGSIVASKKSMSATSGEKRVFVKSRFYIKTSGQSGGAKKGKHSANQSNSRKVEIMANRSDMVSWRPKKLMEVVANGWFEIVEEKLNELLDADGGISKRKDSPRGYLQLLHLTAASGSSGNGETIQSNRDLSMILDAILKTKSRMVLTDIIHKNVLQKLHNMMKQCRRDFKKMPILRKVLKVLEYLAIRGVLRLEHICRGPPHPGVESFIESILSLTEHDDKQVHQIARSFRDRWIPRHARKICFLDRDEERKNFSGGTNSNMMSASHNGCHNQGIRPTEQMDAIIQPELPTTSVDISVHESSSVSCIGDGTGTRKRKSRWDQDKPVLKSVHHDEQKVDSGLQQSEFEKSGNMAGELRDQAASCIDNWKQNMHEDVPPGFLPPPSKPMSSVYLLNATDMPRKNRPPDGLVVGHPQKKFISRLPVSYGIPLPIVQQFGSPEAEYVDSWVIAPGTAFHPFPPLPPGLHPNKEAPSCSVNSLAIGVSEAKQGSHVPAYSCLNVNSPSTSGSNPSGVDHASGNGQQAFKRPRELSHDLGRRYFRQQKSNKPLPWIRNGTRWRNNSRGDGMCTRNLGNIMEQKNSCFSKV